MSQILNRSALFDIMGEQESEIVPADDYRAGIISADPERHSGTPCFTDTRVPIGHLFAYLEAGESLQSFLASFPTVSKDQAVRVLQHKS